MRTASHASDVLQLARSSPALLYCELDGAPELESFITTVRRFVVQQRAVTLAAGLKPEPFDGVGEPQWVLDTLLKALAWRALDGVDCRRLERTGLNALRDSILGSEAAFSLGRQLHTTLGWDEHLSESSAEPALLRQLVWCALLLELEPHALRRPAWLAGFDLCAARNWALSPAQLHDEMIQYLQWRTRDIEDQRCGSMACLALCLLEPLHPELGVSGGDVQNLRCGTLGWANFIHGITLAETLRPGSAVKLNGRQLAALPLEASQNAEPQALHVIAQARIPAALQWAVANGALPHRRDGQYTSMDEAAAVKALDDHAARAARSIHALLAEPPGRIAMAEQKFAELFGGMRYVMSHLTLRPATLGKQLEYSLRNPSPSTHAARFTLLDLFAAGHMKNGRDLFEFTPSSEHEATKEILLAGIDQLKGIDMPRLFDQAFDTYFKQARRGYAFLIETLLGQIPRADQVALARGNVRVFTLEAETRQAVDRESEDDRQLARGRFGFVLQCTDGEVAFSYEVFPLLSKWVRRSDLPPLPETVPIKRVYGYSIRSDTLVGLDFGAYATLREPQPGSRSRCIPVQRAVFEARPDSVLPDTLGLWQLRAIAQTAAHHNLFFHRNSLYAQQRGEGWVEEVERTYPPVLRTLEMLIPGLSCFNAVQTDESPALTCALEALTIAALPLMQMVTGVLKLGLNAGRLVLSHTLPAYVQALKIVSKPSAGTLSSLASRLVSLPQGSTLFRWPQRINGRLGYPLGGQGAPAAARSGGLGRRIDNVAQFDEFVAHNDIFAGRNQVRVDMRAEVSAGAEIRVFTRGNGSRTLLRRDSQDGRLIDLADSSVVTLESQYDYRVLKSWKVAEHDAAGPVVQVPLQSVAVARDTLDPARLASVRNAIESGTPLPAIQLEKTASGYSVINGNHRLQIARELKLDSVPAKIHIPEVNPMQATVEANVERLPKDRL